MIFGQLIHLLWKAMLISYLAMRVITLPFDGIPTLLTSSNYKIGLQPGTSFEDAFKTSTDPMWQKAWNERIETNLNYYQSYFGMYLLF